MKKKIFLADDSITIQKVVELTFSEGDYEVVCVGNGAAAIQRVAEASPDIALLDVIMPERSGYDVCAHIKKHKDLAWMPVVLLTGAFEPYDEQRAREAGADGHMTKPFESRALMTTVEGLLETRPRPGQVATQSAAQSAPPPQAQTLRVQSTDIFAQVPAGPIGQPAPPPPAQRAAAAPAPPASRPAVAPQPAQRPAAQSSPSGSAAAGPAATQGGNGGASAMAPMNVPPEVLERAVREAVAGISEKIIREVAWEVIPDLAEAIIQRRIRELEEEAGS